MAGQIDWLLGTFPPLDAHPLEERDGPRLGLWIGRRQLPGPALGRVLDDPGHFDRGCLGRLRGAFRAVAVSHDGGHGGVIRMGAAVRRQP